MIHEKLEAQAIPRHRRGKLEEERALLFIHVQGQEADVTLEIASARLDRLRFIGLSRLSNAGSLGPGFDLRDGWNLATHKGNQ